ncbi:uracil phosphoribosyltransferase [Sulfuricurvum sp.]|uniref:uracil phosphoribosyltransferase n=1 Tax=Sulfuricurvum sp. TaxID=2025608 RepID=UPI003BB025FA
MHNPIHHPLLQSLVNTLRETALSPLIFRHTIKEITKILLYESLKDMPLKSKTINTWHGEQKVGLIDESEIMVVSVLRAGLPMHDAVIETLSQSKSGFLGIKRDESTHQSHLYYDRVEDCSGKIVIMVDPMIATGGSLCDAIEVVKNKGAGRIISLNIIASPEGIQKVESRYGEVEIFIAQIDEGLDENKFIIPGLGDAGDRAYNTL